MPDNSQLVVRARLEIAARSRRRHDTTPSRPRVRRPELLIFSFQKAFKIPAALSSSTTQNPPCKPSRRASAKSDTKSSDPSTKSSQRKRSCKLQWIPAQINILGNEKVDELPIESRACPHSSNLTTLIDANSIAS
ncbi:hypothetical protein TNCV_1259401 [Trichonephila clavipes]|nr:hypothetical protein TNCV_1259401 [Trichonephila clavipes]